jgi:PAS domain S-box-containing protein
MKDTKSVNMEYKNRVLYLENRLNHIHHILKKVIIGEKEAAKSSLSIYNTDEPEHGLLLNLIEKSMLLGRAKKNKRENKTYAFIKLIRKYLKEDKTYSFLKIIIENVPYPVFIKDETGKYILINSLEADLFGLEEHEILGKHDSDFVKNKKAMEIIRKSDESVFLTNKSIVLPGQKFSLSNGKSYVFKTHKIPFVNPISKQTNILGFSIGVSDIVNLDKFQEILVTKRVNSHKREA